MSTPALTWSPRESALLKGLNTPLKAQQFLDATPYSSDPIYRCPRRVISDRRAHCVDGALFAAAAMRMHGHAPIVTWINAEQDDGHLLALFRRGQLWGSVGKSNFVGLRYREPVYRTLRELVMSYFNDYFNADGYRSMRSYTRPLSLARFDSLAWQTTDEGVTPIIDIELDKLKTFPIAPAAAIKSLKPVDTRTLKAGMLGVNKAGLFKAS